MPFSNFPLPIELVALNKMAYGHRPGDIGRVRNMGLANYVEEQLNPSDDDDSECNSRLQTATLAIEYAAAGEGKDRYEAVKEDRTLRTLNQSYEELWPLVDGKKTFDYQETIRPTEEVRVATWIRALYSKWQLREIMTQFWHNHFNINAYKDSRISVVWPVYDRDVIRKHCFGNFREFVEAVGSHSAMLYYLDNAASKASPANENYARELFELHTLGAENYLNHLYNRWRDVPGAVFGAASGYIDQDVYEASRAFTGWTVADGADNGKGETFPNTGRFHYYEGWHDNYQKRILGVEYDPNQPPLADGKKVFDLVAFHPGTARHICKKLCQRFVSDNPPESLIERITSVWRMNQNQPDQIKRTVKAILLSPEFALSYGQKVKNPMELIVSFLRATSADVKPNWNMTWYVYLMGYMLFQYPPPTGHPDKARYWLSTNVMLGRWNTLLYLQSDWMGAATFNLREQIPPHARSARQILNYWMYRLLGYQFPRHIYSGLIDLLRQNGSPDAPLAGDDEDLKARIDNLVALIGMTPQFQLR